MEASTRVASLEFYRIDVKGLEDEEQVKSETWQSLCRALKTDRESFKVVRRAGITRGFINLAYLLVLTGCELDLYGFGMAFSDYWALEELFIRILLITGPVSYLLACAMYIGYSGDVERRQEEQRQREEQRSRPAVNLTFLQPDQPPAGSPQQQPQPPQLAIQPSKEAVQMRYYHFLPLCRYYLVVKEKETDDIESLFRVNSLSSFSLGIAQLCGIVFSGLATDWEMSIFTYINIASQIINWSITVMYFMTNVATKMGNAMKVEAMTYNSDLRLRRLWEQYLAVVEQKSQANNSETNAAMQQFTGNIDREILTLANVSGLDLSPFDMESKFTALKFLSQRQIRVYAQI